MSSGLLSAILVYENGIMVCDSVCSISTVLKVENELSDITPPRSRTDLGMSMCLGIQGCMGVCFECLGYNRKVCLIHEFTMLESEM